MLVVRNIKQFLYSDKDNIYLLKLKIITRNYFEYIIAQIEINYYLNCSILISIINLDNLKIDIIAKLVFIFFQY